jgi:hypothetical protein
MFPKQKKIFPLGLSNLPFSKVYYPKGRSSNPGSALKKKKEGLVMFQSKKERTNIFCEFQVWKIKELTLKKEFLKKIIPDQ